MGKGFVETVETQCIASLPFDFANDDNCRDAMHRVSTVEFADDDICRDALQCVSTNVEIILMETHPVNGDETGKIIYFEQFNDVRPTQLVRRIRTNWIDGKYEVPESA